LSEIPALNLLHYSLSTDGDILIRITSILLGIIFTLQYIVSTSLIIP